MVIKADFAIVGGGVIGLSIARRLSRLHPKCSIALLDKDPMGTHSSGRNSGVLHAGFYYASDSQKAKYSVLGNKAWRDFCDKHQVPMRRTGKYVVMPNGQSDSLQAAQAEHLQFLFEQGQRNGVELEMVSIEEARKKESRITGQDGSQALYSPNTAVVDIQACLRKLHSLCEDENPNYEAHYGASYKSWLGGREIDSSIGRISFKHLINCAGQ